MPVAFLDLDGVLIDSRRAIGHCVDVALVAHGLQRLDPCDLDRLIGPPLQQGFAYVVRERAGDPGLVPGLVLAYRECYRETSLEMTTLMPGIGDALPVLAANGPLVVATSKPLRFAEPILERLGVRSFFAVVVGPTPETDGESKTQTLGRAIGSVKRHGGAMLDRATMTGDRYHDIEAALTHGLRPIGVTWGSGSREELEVAGAEAIVDSVPALVALLTSGA